MKVDFANDSSVRFERVDETSPFFPQLKDVFHAVLEPLYGSQKEALEKIVKKEDRVCELMLVGNTPVGVFQYKTALQFEYGLEDGLEVKSLFLINAAENSGRGLGSRLGSRLVEHAEEVARTRWAQGVYLTVSENCPSSQAFFEKKGFQNIGVLGKEYISGVKEYLFVKPVRQVTVLPKDTCHVAGRVVEVSNEVVGQKVA